MKKSDLRQLIREELVNEDINPKIGQKRVSSSLAKLESAMAAMYKLKKQADPNGSYYIQLRDVIESLEVATRRMGNVRRMFERGGHY